MFKSDREIPIDCDPRAMLLRFRSKNASGSPFAWFVRGVPHAASHTVRPKSALIGTFECIEAPSFQSRVVGVGQPARATVFRLLSLFPAALFPFCAGVPAIGVGQPARFDTSFRVT
jgi:hypothetical protein